MQSWIVAYDISDPKRLRRVARCCEDFGERKQYSVFLCRISLTDFAKLRARLYDLIDKKEDQVLFIPLCGKCVQTIECIGWPSTAYNARDVVIVA
jgi:CRISPR-associated protein Cas2